MIKVTFRQIAANHAQKQTGTPLIKDDIQTVNWIVRSDREGGPGTSCIMNGGSTALYGELSR